MASVSRSTLQSANRPVSSCVLQNRNIDSHSEPELRGAEHRNRGLAVGVFGNWRPVDEYNVAVVNTKILKKHASYDAMARA